MNPLPFRAATTPYLARLTLLPLFVLSLALGFPVSALGNLVITEIMYHPVEEPAFNADGSPVLDLYEDVHEFVELQNVGSEPVSLAGWELSGGIRYSFPEDAVIGAGERVVIAKAPSRLLAVPQYSLAGIKVMGPYDGQLGNREDTIRLRDGSGSTVESVSYSAAFPWAIGADALGANDDFTGLRETDYQYRGRSLERVSVKHPASDAANWLASPLPGEPSPGQPNAVMADAPKPVVVSFDVAQSSNDAALIRNGESVRIDCAFSSLESLSDVGVEWFLEDIETTGEPTQVASMTAEAGGFSVVLPGQADRTIVRFRFVADRGTGREVVSPRADDPFRWHAYFVTPNRTSSRPIYDCFISSRSQSVLASNISQSPRRVTSPDPPGNPRASWNATEPAVMVHDGVVYDIRMRHHGSRYNRNVNRWSLKWQFPRYKKFNGVTGIFETDKGNDFIVGHGLFRAAGLPVSPVRYVDLYLNDRSVMQRLEQGEFDGDMLDAYHREQQALNPGSALEPSGEIYKAVGTIDMGGEGPYGRGDGRLLKKTHWTDLQMYEWTYALQNNGWRGAYYWKQMIDAFWAARGDTPDRPNPNVSVFRTFFTNYFDVDELLTYIALENWCCPWDDSTQNHFFWQRRNGKWGMLPWDNDAWYGRGDNTPASSSIFIGEVGDPNNNYRGPNFFKDAFIKAFRQELKERFFLLNNTFLHPDNLSAMGFGSIRSFAQQRMAAVNQQCGLGVFQRPNKPSNMSPIGGVTALPPMMLTASAFTHTAPQARAHTKTTWEIRAADGDYQVPVWKATSASDLTSVRIPFESLRFGQRYYWRATYFDADDHPSVASDETSFNFGPSSAQAALVPIDAESAWRYNQAGADHAPAGWNTPGYDDSAWASGMPLLAKEESVLPEPLRTPLNLGQTTYYFRKRFDFPGPTQGATASLRYIVDDGCVIYINGKELIRVRMPGGAISHGTFASQNVGEAVYEGPVDVPSSFFTTGENVIAVEVHQSNANSSDVVFGLSMEAVLPAGAGVVVLNEIAARNTGSVVHEGEAPDWIELYNNGAETVDLGGSTLSDDVLNPRKFVFPPNTLIAARGYLTVWCDSNTNAPGLHTGFGLNDEGQTVALFAPGAGGLAVRDFVTFGLQVADLTLGRRADGTGNWGLTSPTPGAPNQVQDLAPASSVRINEWMASPISGDDWIELFNPADLPVAIGGLSLTDDMDDPDQSELPPWSFIAPGGFVEMIADGNVDAGANHLSFRLSAGGEVIGLFDAATGARIDSVSFGPQTTDISQGRLPDGNGPLTFFPSSASPGEANYLALTNVVISEVLARARPPLEDAIELQNVSAGNVDISGWWLSDSWREPRKCVIPAGTVLGPGQFVVFYQHQFEANPGASNSFALNGTWGEEVVLSETDGADSDTGRRDRVEFGPTPQGTTIGRVPVSGGYDFAELVRPTLGVDAPATLEEFRQGRGASNAPPWVGPVVISEVMYHPPDLGTEDNRRDEFIELFNRTGAPVALFDAASPGNTWRIRGAVDFEFPAGVTLSAQGTAVVVGFDPETDHTARAGFEAVYGPVEPLFGPFQGKLDNDGDDVRLVYPGALEDGEDPDVGSVPSILADRVHYFTAAPWPISPDGNGPSLARVDPGAHGNDAANWTGAQPSPGRVSGSAPVWRLDIGQTAAGVLTIQAAGASVANVVVQSSTDLVTWENIATLSGASGMLEFPLADRSGTARYYRVALQP
ncbi:MAG: lamin tail domain-containing protein [Verrucomicrobiia bacterium]